MRTSINLLPDYFRLSVKHRALFIALLLPASLSAQDGVEAFKPALLQAKMGAVLVYNGSNHAFTVRITGKNLVPPTEEHPNFIHVNGQLLQVDAISYASNGDVTDLPEETMKKFLIGYQQHESSYFKHELKVPMSNEKTAFIHLGNHLFLSWEFDTNFRGKDKVTKQLFLASICFNRALVMNCPITKAADITPAKALLAATGATLTLKNEPVNLTELYHQLEKE